MFLLIDKPKGVTSHDVVNSVRRITGERKVGHAGTLDPNATGLLIVGVGRESTKRLNRFLKLDKEYIAEIYLGEERDTDDITGKFLISPPASANSLRSLRRKHLRAGNSEFLIKSQIPIFKIQAVLKSFVGNQLQVPPVYSAVKIKGKEAYKLARAGKKVEVKPRKVTIYDAKLLEYKFPLVSAKFKVSSGTYIRSIARDMGRKLKTGAYLSNLIRTKVGKYSVENAVSLNELTSSNWKKNAFNI